MGNALPGLPVDREWFSVPTLELAQRLLGTCLLRRNRDGTPVGGRIVETEAYLHDDPACHAFRGERPRTAAMFLEAGHAYVYLIYGLHHCFNVVSGPAGIGEAVLVRALEPLWGIDTMVRRRGTQRNLCNGPARLCQALGIERDRYDGIDLRDEGDIAIRRIDRKMGGENGPAGGAGAYVATRRIGLSTARSKMWRFAAVENASVSAPRPKAAFLPVDQLNDPIEIVGG